MPKAIATFEPHTQQKYLSRIKPAGRQLQARTVTEPSHEALSRRELHRAHSRGEEGSPRWEGRSPRRNEKPRNQTVYESR